MRISIDTGHKDPGPLNETRILNTDECGIAGVGVNIFGELFYRKSWHLLGSSAGIQKVIFLRSHTHRNRVSSSACEADFDIYLEDGRVIEVNTCNRSIIQAALAYAPKKDVRDSSRKARGR